MRRLAILFPAAGLYATVGVRALLNWGATPAERAARLPGDEVIPGAHGGGTMATTIDAPPERVWPWLAQMGNGRAGFYSWDRLDNGGRPSARELHSEWQDIAVGARIATLPDGKSWFDVVRCEPPHTLVLRASLSLGGRPFDPSGRPPRAYTDSIWAFHLRPLEGGRTRLLVRSRGRGRPGRILELVNVVFWHPAHWVMQTRQFSELRRRAESVDDQPVTHRVLGEDTRLDELEQVARPAGLRPGA